MRSFFKTTALGVMFFAAIAKSSTAFTTSTPPFKVASCWKPQARQSQNNVLVESRCQTKKFSSTSLLKAKINDMDDTEDRDDSSFFSVVMKNPTKSIWFSVIMVVCGAALGPFLDSYHSSFGVLEYEVPLKLQLWGASPAQPALTTAWWVPELFGLAGFIIGWLYILLDNAFTDEDDNNDAIKQQQQQNPSWPQIFVGISYFTLQYWLSGVLSFMGVSRTIILIIMSILAAAGYIILDNTKAGFFTSLATAVGGPLIEVGLLSTLHGHGGYQYMDAVGSETGFFPLWIVPVYFLGGPAVGNLARGVWNQLSAAETRNTKKSEPSPVCNDTRRVPCPNCDGVGTYVTYGKSITCTSCRGRGFVICRNCFSNYNEDPNDIEAIRELMSRMPD